MPPTDKEGKTKKFWCHYEPTCQNKHHLESDKGMDETAADRIHWRHNIIVEGHHRGISSHSNLTAMSLIDFMPAKGHDNYN